MALRLTLVTPEQTVFDGDVNKVIVPGVMGEFEILPKHAPIVSVLNKGKVSYQTADGTNEEIMVQAGFVSVKRNQVNVCVEV